VLLDRILAERKAAWAASGARGKYAEPAKPESEGLPGLPEGWCWASGEQVSDGVESGTTPTKEHFVEGPGVPFIKVYHLTFTRNLDCQGPREWDHPWATN
jgi:type I restriction enzyme S subunit